MEYTLDPDSKEAEELRKYVRTTSDARITFAFALDVSGKIKVHLRLDQPCYGDMRTHYDDVERPEDLKNPFPTEGTPVAVACRLKTYGDKNSTYYKWIGFLLDPSVSPYRNTVLPALEVLRDGDGKPLGWVCFDTKVDVDVLVHFMIFARDSLAYGNAVLDRLLGMNIPVHYASLLMRNIGTYGSQLIASTGYSDSYTMPMYVSVKNWLLGTPQLVNPDAGRHWFYDRAAYNRDESGNLCDIWIGDKSDRPLPDNWKDILSETKTPSPWSTAYYLIDEAFIREHMIGKLERILNE